MNYDWDEPRPQEYICGLDLAQAQDYTALAILETISPAGAQEREYHVRHLERFPLGTLYPIIAANMRQRLNTPPLRRHSELIVDATGVGRPVVDMLKQAGLEPIGITITGGDKVTQEDSIYRVPKRDLVSTLQILMQTKRIGIAAALPEVATITKELLNFQVKIDPRTAHDSYGAWREGAHDDLVLAVALAAWYGETQAGLVCQWGVNPLVNYRG